MPSASPSPVKRPSLTGRTSSTNSLSSSAKQTTVHKPHKPRVVGRHSRNLSHGKNLSKLNRVHSSANVTDAKAHQRKKSGEAATSKQSPTSPGLPPKRVGSHTHLPKNTSHTNLRKNQSATALALRRNVSHVGVKKLGLAPTPKPKNEDKKTGFFEIGDGSSGGEEENEWIDSTTHSPELTRNNSKASTPARIATPINGERHPQRHMGPGQRQDRTSSPPTASLIAQNNNRSLPDLRRDSDDASPAQTTPDPALLSRNGHRSQALPAMSTISAVHNPNILRNESSKSFTHIDHADAQATPSTPHTTHGSSGADGGVSHFLQSTPSSHAPMPAAAEGESDSDSTAFMSNYKVMQPSPSPTKQPSHQLNRSYFPAIPSRTQQKLELQRREAMRSGNAATTPPSSLGMGIVPGSSLSLHSRTGSRGGRIRTSAADDAKMLKADYEAGAKQLSVVRRFRNPTLESMTRLKERKILLSELGTGAPHTADKARPPSRRGHQTPTIVNGILSKPTPTPASRSSNPTSDSENKKPTPAPAGRVHFQPPPQRQASHEGLGVTPSQNSDDVVGPDSDDDGMSVEESMMRRLWQTREVWVREPAVAQA